MSFSNISGSKHVKNCQNRRILSGVFGQNMSKFRIISGQNAAIQKDRSDRGGSVIPANIPGDAPGANAVNGLYIFGPIMARQGPF
jgi:hypothetical protein